MVALRRGAWVISIGALVAACSGPANTPGDARADIGTSIDVPGPFDGGGDAGGGGDSAFVPDGPPGDATGVMGADFDLGFFDTARDMLAGGAMHDAALTSDGRWHESVDRAADGSVTTTLTLDGHTVRRTTWSADGLTATGDVDNDHDGVLEEHVVITRGPTPTDQSVVITEVTPGTTTVTRQSTWTRTDDTTVDVTVQQPDDTGTLQTVAEYNVDTVQASDPVRPLDPGSSAACMDPAMAMGVQNALHTAIGSGVDCIGRVRFGLKGCLMDLLATHDVQVHCNNAGRYAQVSWWDALMGAPDGVVDINIDPSLFLGLSPTEAAGTLFHELVHMCLGGHNPGDIADDDANADVNYNDPVYACAAMCFGGALADRCVCARCRGTDACDPACAAYPPCNPDRAQCGCDSKPIVYQTATACAVNCPSGLACFAAGCMPYRPACGGN